MPHVRCGSKTWTAPKLVIRQAIAMTPHGADTTTAARGSTASGPGRMDPAPAPVDPPWKEIETMMTNERPYCQVAGCHHHAVRCVDLDLPMAWEATRDYTTIRVVACLCSKHGHDVNGRLQAMLEARVEFHDLLHIITAAMPYEREQREKLERAEADIERLELELSAARQQLRDTEAELRLARALRGLDQRRVVARALDVALNSGDGVYRP